MFIHGESFDYIGCTRLVHDMKKSEFPFNISDESLMEKFSNGSQPVFALSSIHSIIEIDQVTNTDSDSIYLHTSNNPSQIVNSMLSNTRGWCRRLQRLQQRMPWARTGNLAKVVPSLEHRLGELPFSERVTGFVYLAHSTPSQHNCHLELVKSIRKPILPIIIIT